MARVEDVLGGEFDNGQLKLSLSWDTVDEAMLLKKKIINQQKQLRQIKREINLDMKNIRASYKQASDNVQPSFLSVFASRGASKKSVADQRRKLRAKRDRELEPYNNTKLTIDNILLQLDGAKLSLTEYINDNK